MNKRAFTLVELLVVIGIIVMLISILLPSLNRARNAAREVLCQSNLRQIGIAVMLYADQSKGMMPADSDFRFKDTDGDRSNRSIGWWDDPSIWLNAVNLMIDRKTYGERQLADPAPQLPNYTTGRSVFVCPQATEPGNSTASTDQVFAGGAYHQMWGHANRIAAPATVYPAISGVTDIKGAGPVARKVYTSYAMNSQLNPISATDGKTRLIVKQSQLKPSPEIVLIMERRMNLAELPGLVSSQYGSPGGNDLPSRRLNRIKAKWDYATARHRGGGNYLMADGHVAWFSMSDVVLPPGYTSGATTVDFNQPGKLLWSPFGRIYP